MEKAVRYISTKNFIFGLWPLVVIAVVLQITGGLIWPAYIAYHVGIFLLPCLSRSKASLSLKGWRTWLPVTGLASVFLLIINYGFTLRMWQWGLITPEGITALKNTRPWAGFVIYMLVLNPLLEEYYWRSFLQERAGIFLTTTLFAIMHYPLYALLFGSLYGLIGCVFPFLFGLFWGWQYRYYNSIWPGVITHLAVNIAMLAVASRALT